MAQKMTGNTGKVIAAFFLLILGIALLTTVATESNDRTSLSATTETIDVTAAKLATSINESYVLGPFATLEDTNIDCPITGLTITNSSGTALALTTDYVPALGAGTFTLVSTDQAFNGTADNDTLIAYSYCPIGYMNLGWGRTGINVVPGFFAIALMLVAVALFWQIYQDIKLD